MKRAVLLSLLCCVFHGCSYFRSDSEHPDRTAFDQEQLRRDLRPLALAVPYVPTKAIEDYFDFYGLAPPGAAHHFGTIESEGEVLAAHVYLPPDPRGSIFMVHGYFDHAGTLSRLIAESVRRNYAVVVWDLPGHGLSTGARTDTGAFDRCARQLADIVARASSVLPEPFYLVAHSTGASISMEYLHASGGGAFASFVFLAPLVRHAHWDLGRFAYAVSEPFSTTLRRRARKNSSDEAYLDFVKRDPLHSDVMSYEYLEDLYAWERAARDYPVRSGALCIVQGDQDAIVDWRYNLEFFAEKVERPRIEIVKGARHQLANESESIRDEVFRRVFACLE